MDSKLTSLKNLVTKAVLLTAPMQIGNLAEASFQTQKDINTIAVSTDQTLGLGNGIGHRLARVDNKTFTPVVFRADENKDAVISKATQTKIDATKKQLDSILDLISKEKLNPVNATEVAQKAYESQVGGILGRFLGNPAKEEIQKVTNILTVAKAQGLPKAAMTELTNRLSHLKEGFDIKKNDQGETTIENLKETHPDAVAYEASTRLLQALENASKALPDGSDRTSLFTAALINGIAFEMYVSVEDRLAGKISPEIKQVTKNIAEIITSLDDKSKNSLFKAAGFLMNWDKPMRLLEANLKADTSAENKTFETIMGALKNSVDTEAQQKIFLAFLNHANEKYFAGKLDKATLEEVSRIKDPLRLVDADTQVSELVEILARVIKADTDATTVTSSVNTLVNIANATNTPDFYMSADQLGYKEPVALVKSNEAAAILKTELNRLK